MKYDMVLFLFFETYLIERLIVVNGVAFPSELVERIKLGSRWNWVVGCGSRYIFCLKKKRKKNKEKRRKIFRLGKFESSI